MNARLTLGAMALLAATGCSNLSEVRPARLRCEYQTNPLAVNASRPRLSWVLEAEQRGIAQTAYQILAADSEADLAAGRGNVWNTGRIASDETVQIVYAGKPIAAGQEVFWKVRVWTSDGAVSPWSAPAVWRVGLREPADWSAEWIGLPGTVPEGRLPARPSPMLRKSFILSRPVVRALVSVSALGVYEMSINGQRVGRQVLAPEWTDYHSRVQYQTYDVTPLVREGENAVGAILADGWYAGRLGISHIMGKDDPFRGHYGKQLGLLARLDVEYADGTTETIGSDASWKGTSDGPIRTACILDGESYEAAREKKGWDAPGFDDSGWTAVEVMKTPAAKVVAQVNEPMRVTQDIVPVSVSEPKPGVFVFDLGQNIAGWCRVQVAGKAGRPVTLRHAEVLSKDGTLYRDNLRINNEGYGARAEDVYTPAADGEFAWEPRFTYHGFRYVELTGAEGTPGLTAIVGRVFHSDPPPAGVFECSDPMINKLMSNIVWTLRDNLPSVPTDCPQRDERLGWMGDMLAFSQSACFLMDMGAFFTKWTQDIRDDQAADGRYPDFAPHPFEPDKRFSGVPAWGDCGVVVPWRMYINYGDTRVLDEHFESARRWVDWIHQHNSSLLWEKDRNNDYGDWLNGDTFQFEIPGVKKGTAEVPKEVFATGMFYQSARIVARMAALTGRAEEAAKYGKLADDIKAAFQEAYMTPDGKMKRSTQASYAMILDMGLAPADKRSVAIEEMAKAINDYNGHISTGFHTTVMLMKELSRNGLSDVAYKLLNHRTLPSWGYTIDHGATTIWERWDGYVAGHGFQNAGMNSFCHYSIGSVGEWMYRAILGINPDEEHPGYKHFVIRPRPGGGLSYARGRYDSIRGPIGSAWRIDGDELTLMVEIPANTTATVYVPASSPEAVTESGVPAADAYGLTYMGMESGTAVYKAVSGTYWFVSKGFPR